MTCPFGCDPAPCELCIRCAEERRPSPMDHGAWMMAAGLSVAGLLVVVLLALELAK
jgi:hypothetical protein